jgi:predicted nucleic acid-binding protein
MVLLVDTGVLLRLLNRADPLHQSVRKCLRTLKARGDEFAVAPQIMAQFWNVSTRPASARGGYGLSVAETQHHLNVVERVCDVIPDSLSLYPVWKDLVVLNAVTGVQVHDARLVAWMKTQAISHIITFNVTDFARYGGIVAKSPVDF